MFLSIAPPQIAAGDLGNFSHTTAVKMPSKDVATLKSFCLFPLLPTELRLQIWNLSLQPRILSLRYSPETRRFISATEAPAILQTNHESRTEGLRTYKLSFSTVSSPARIYFAPHLDTLYVPRYRRMGYDETLRDLLTFIPEDARDCVEAVRRIAIDHVDTEVKRPWESYNKACFIRSFPQLEEVILVLCDSENGDLAEQGMFEEPKSTVDGLYGMWADFRGNFLREERALKEACRMNGTAYVKRTLPRVSLRARSRALLASEASTSGVAATFMGLRISTTI